MAKNCMAAVAKLLGVELGEEFIIENKEQIDSVLSAGRYVRCISCGVVTNTMFYFCPWCGVKQHFIRGEE